MKILLQYLKPYKWMVVLLLILAAINTGFSLVDPILLGKLVNLASDHLAIPGQLKFDWDGFFWNYRNIPRGKEENYLELGVFYILKTTLLHFDCKIILNTIKSILKQENTLML